VPFEREMLPGVVWIVAVPLGPRPCVLCHDGRSRKSVTRWSPDDLASPTGMSNRGEVSSPNPVQVRSTTLVCLARCRKLLVGTTVLRSV